MHRIFAFAITGLLTAGTAHAIDPDVRCGSGKIREAVKYAFCLGKEEAKAIKKGELPAPLKCDTKFSTKWQTIEAKGAEDCPSILDEVAIQEKVQDFVKDLVSSLAPPPDLCLASAVEVSGACWYLGNSGESCDTACVNVGLVYDPETEEFAGSGGTLAGCGEVMTALSQSTPVDDPSCADGWGCSVDDGTGDSFRCTSPTTTSSAAIIGIIRACACKQL